MQLLPSVQGLQKTGTCLCLWSKASELSQLAPKLEVHNYVDRCPSLGLISGTALALYGAAVSADVVYWVSLTNMYSCVVVCRPPHINSCYIVTCWWQLLGRAVMQLSCDSNGRWFRLRLPAQPRDYFHLRSVRNDSGCPSTSYSRASLNDGDTFSEMRR